MQQIRDESDVDKEFDAIMQSHENSKTEEKTDAWRTLLKVFLNAHTRACPRDCRSFFAGID